MGETLWYRLKSTPHLGFCATGPQSRKINFFDSFSLPTNFTWGLHPPNFFSTVSHRDASINTKFVRVAREMAELIGAKPEDTLYL